MENRDRTASWAIRISLSRFLRPQAEGDLQDRTSLQDWELPLFPALECRAEARRTALLRTKIPIKQGPVGEKTAAKRNLAECLYFV